MAAFILLALEGHDAVVEGIHQHPGDDVLPDRLARLAAQPPAPGLARELLQRVLTGGIDFKEFLHQQCPLGVHDDRVVDFIVPIAEGREAGPATPAQLLPIAALHVLAQAVHVVLRLPERDRQHKLSLRGVLEAVGGEAKVVKRGNVQHVDDAPAVHRIAGKPVRVPCQQPLGFAGFHLLHHEVKHWPARMFCSFRLDEFLDDNQAFASRELPQLMQLRVNRHDLLVFLIGRLARVEKIGCWHGTSSYEGVARHGAPRHHRQFLKTIGSNLGLTNRTLALTYTSPFGLVAQRDWKGNWGALADSIRDYFERSGLPASMKH